MVPVLILMLLLQQHQIMLVVNTLLLTQKTDLEQFVDRLDKAEFLALVKFLLVTLIVYPALPNQNYTQFNLNPAHIWQVVILVSTIGFVGYFLSKQFGRRVGLWLSGILGGIVSSTATSLALGRMVQRHTARSRDALQAAILASSVMYLRILLIILVLAPATVVLMAWKMVVLSVVGGVLAATILEKPEGQRSEAGSEVMLAPEPAAVLTGQNPFELRPALIFGALFVVLTVVTEYVFQVLGNAGLLGLSAIVGMTDIDPYVLSLVRRTQ